MNNGTAMRYEPQTRNHPTRTKINRINQKTTTPTAHNNLKTTHRCIRNRLKPGLDPTLHRVDVADQGDVDRPAEVDDDVRELAISAIGAEVDRAFQGLV